MDAQDKHRSRCDQGGTKEWFGGMSYEQSSHMVGLQDPTNNVRVYMVVFIIIKPRKLRISRQLVTKCLRQRVLILC